MVDDTSYHEKIEQSKQVGFYRTFSIKNFIFYINNDAQTLPYDIYEVECYYTLNLTKCSVANLSFSDQSEHYPNHNPWCTVSI